MYDVHYKRYSGSEKRFEGLYRGTQDYGGGIVIYMRGGYRYSVLTDATEVNTYTSAQTLDNSVFAIKDVDGSDVSGTSTAIGRIVHIAGTGDFEKRFMSGNLQFDGNVGIGTTSPATKLHVEHYGSAIGDFEGIRIANHATNLHATSRPAYEFVVSDINSGTGIGHGKFAIGYRGTTSASRTDRLVIDDSGNVGVGVTDPGGYKLNVNGAILGTTIRGTQLNINGVGGILSGGGNIAANTGVDTGVSLYAGNSGGSIYLMISGQNNSGSQTGTWAYIVRRYHSTTNTWTNSASTVTQLAAMNGMTSPNPGNPTLYLNSSTGRLDFKFPNAAANYKFTAYVI
jgi:VCBS repeat-containing protein